MSHTPLRSSRPVAPRPRHDRPAPESIPASDSSWPPVLVRFPNLEQASHELLDTVESVPPAAEPTDSDVKEESLVHSPPEATIPNLPDTADEPVTRDKPRPDKSLSRQQGRWSDRPDATEIDWRSPAYKLGGTLVAAVLVVIVLLALNRGNDNVSSTVMEPLVGPPELADVPTPPSPGVENTVPIETASTEPTQNLGSSIDESWLAENLSSAAPSDAETMSPPDGAPQDNLDATVRPDPYALAADTPTSEPRSAPTSPAAPGPAYEQTPNYEQTPAYEQTADSTWNEPAGTPGRARLSASAEMPRGGPRQADASALWPARAPHENHGPIAGYPEQRLPERFQRADEFQAANPTQLSAETRGQPPRDVAMQQSYPSTPHVAMFPTDRDNSINRAGNSPPVRTADRDVQNYRWPSSQPSDTNRAPARLQGRIEPYETGSNEQYR